MAVSVTIKEIHFLAPGAEIYALTDSAKYLIVLDRKLVSPDSAQRLLEVLSYLDQKQVGVLRIEGPIDQAIRLFKVVKVDDEETT